MVPVQTCHLVDQSNAFRKQADFDPPSVLRGTGALDKAEFFATRDQRNDAVMLCLKTLRQFSDRRPVPARVTFDLKQQLILLRLNSVLAGQLFAEPDEFAELITKIRERLKIAFTQRAGVAFGHRVSDEVES